MKYAIAIIIGLTIGACDQRALQVTQCALSDGKLSVAFRDPGRAKTYLTDLGKRLKAKDGQAINEAADLISRMVECLE